MYGWIGGFFAISAHQRSREARDAAHDNRDDIQTLRWTINDLTEQLGRHALALQTLMTIATRKGLFTEDELRETLQEIDLMDGRLDGKYVPKATPLKCTKCGKTNGRSAASCMYCGTILLPETPI